MTPNRRNGIKEAGYLTHDPGAALVAVMPEAITSSARVYCDVEVQVRTQLAVGSSAESFVTMFVQQS